MIRAGTVAAIDGLSSSRIKSNPVVVSCRAVLDEVEYRWHRIWPNLNEFWAGIDRHRITTKLNHTIGTVIGPSAYYRECTEGLERTANTQSFISIKEQRQMDEKNTDKCPKQQSIRRDDRGIPRIKSRNTDIHDPDHSRYPTEDH